MATVMLTPFAAFSPESANPSDQDFTAGVDSVAASDHYGYRGGASGFGTLGMAGDGFIPEGLHDIYYNNETDKIYIATEDGAEWPYLWPLESITIDPLGTPVTYPVEFQLSLNVPNADDQTYYNTDTDMWHESSASGNDFVWDSGTAPDSMDISVAPTAVDQHAWDGTRWYTSIAGPVWGAGELPTEGVFDGDPSELDRWRTIDDITSTPFVDGTGYKVRFNWKWTPDRFLDINMPNTSFTEL